MAIKRKILKIMSLALEISSPTEKRVFGDEKPDVFVDYSPHCSSLTVQIHLLGWHMDKDCGFDFNTCSMHGNPVIANERLDEIIEKLEWLKGVT